MRTCEWLIPATNIDHPHIQRMVRCDKPCEGKNALCATHSRLSRKMFSDAEREAEKRQLLLSKQKAKQSEPRQVPRKVSAKREELNEEYFKLVEQFKKDNPECKAKVNEYCTKTTDDPHHQFGRGKYLLDVSTWLPVCRSCHIWIEAHPKEAKQKGWSESRLATIEPHKI